MPKAVPTIVTRQVSDDESLGQPLFAWKRIEDGWINDEILARSKEILFESAGFGAVRVDEPIKGFLAVPVRETEDGRIVELEPEAEVQSV